jgi:hypothetical protein
LCGFSPRIRGSEYLEKGQAYCRFSLLEDYSTKAVDKYVNNLTKSIYIARD